MVFSLKISAAAVLATAHSVEAVRSETFDQPEAKTAINLSMTSSMMASQIDETTDVATQRQGVIMKMRLMQHGADQYAEYVVRHATFDLKDDKIQTCTMDSAGRMLPEMSSCQKTLRFSEWFELAEALHVQMTSAVFWNKKGKLKWSSIIPFANGRSVDATFKDVDDDALQKVKNAYYALRSSKRTYKLSGKGDATRKMTMSDEVLIKRASLIRDWYQAYENLVQVTAFPDNGTDQAEGIEKAQKMKDAFIDGTGKRTHKHLMHWIRNSKGEIVDAVAIRPEQKPWEDEKDENIGRSKYLWSSSSSYEALQSSRPNVPGSMILLTAHEINDQIVEFIN